MADDLGVIDYRDPRINQVGDSGIARELAGLGDLAIMKRKRDILGEFREAEQALVDQELAGDPQDAETIDEALLTPTGVKEIDDFQRRTQRLRAAIDQGDVSQRGLAELNLKRELAKFQARFPGMHQELATEFGRFVATDAGLDELGLRDARAAEYSKLAAQDLKRLEDYAYKRPSEGGLGISPAVNSSEPAFAAQFVYRDGLFSALQLEALHQLVQQSNTQAGARQAVATFERNFKGPTATMYATMTGILEEVDAVFQALSQGLDGTTSELIAEWETGGKGQALASIERLQIEIGAMYTENIEPRFRDTAEAQRAKASVDEAIAHLQRFSTALQQNSPDLVKAWEIEKEVRTAQIRDRSKPLDQALDFITAIAPIFPLAEAIGPFNEEVESTVSKLMGKGVVDAAAQIYLDGPQEQGPESADGVMNEAQLERESRRNRSINPTECGLASTDDMDQKQATFHCMQNYHGLVTHMNQAESPKARATMIAGIGSMFDRVWELGGVTQMQMDEVRRLVSNPSWVEAVVEGDADPRIREAVAYAGNMAFRVWDSFQGGENDRQALILRPLAQTRIEGIRSNSLYGAFNANEILEFNIDDLQNGNIQVEINPEKFDAVLARVRKPEPTGVFVQTPQARANQAARERVQLRERLERVARDVEQLTKEYLVTNAHIDYSRRIKRRPKGVPVDYVRAFFGNAYDRILPTPIPVGNQ